MKKPEKIDQLEIAKKFCLLQPCEVLKDEATGGCYACKIGSSITNAFVKGRADMEAYHNWVLGRLPSEEELTAIDLQVEHDLISGHIPDGMTRAEYSAKAIAARLRERK